MIAADIMTRDVFTIDERSSLAHAVTVMSEQGIRHLPVLSAGKTLAGIISDHDLSQFNLSRVSDISTYERLQARLRVSVASVMSADVVTVAPETDLEEVVELMIEERIGALPVVDPETDVLVGMVSYVDVLRAAREALRESEPS